MGRRKKTIPFSKPPKGFPSKLNILGQIWEVKYAKGLAEHEGLFGFTNNHKRVIVVDAEQGREALSDTLLHESIHAMLHTGGLVDISEKIEERVCRCLTPALISFYRSNKTWW